jgi:hypothetical protein
MPSFTVSLDVRYLMSDADGLIRRLPRAVIRPFVRTADGWYRFPDSVIDTGATYTTMSATLARSVGIPVPAETRRLAGRTAAGSHSTRVHDGEIRVRFTELPGHTFRLYCVFNEQTPPVVPPLFGLNDFLDVFRLTFDGRPSADALFGHVRLDTAD